MATKPYRLHPTPAAPTQKAAENTASPPAGVGVVRSRDGGQPLPTPSQLQAQQHGHSTELKYPQPAGGPDDKHKPMKLGKQ